MLTNRYEQPFAELPGERLERFLSFILAKAEKQAGQDSFARRIWEDGRIKEVPEDHFEEELLAVIEELQTKEEDGGFVRAGVAAGEALDRQRQLIPYDFLDYRLWTLIGEGRLLYRGMPGELYKYAVRVPRAIEQAGPCRHP